MVWSVDDDITLNHQQGGGSGQEQELDEGGKSEEEESLDAGWRGEGRLNMMYDIFYILYDTYMVWVDLMFLF